MKNKIFVGLAVLVALVAAWIVLFPGKTPWSYLKKKTISASTGDTSAPATAITPAPSAPATKGADGFPVVYGDKGTDVAAIQEGLNLKFGSNLSVDGIFGPLTRKALSAHGYSDTITKAQYLEIVI